MGIRAPESSALCVGPWKGLGAAQQRREGLRAGPSPLRGPEQGKCPSCPGSEYMWEAAGACKVAGTGGGLCSQEGQAIILRALVSFKQE